MLKEIRFEFGHNWAQLLKHIDSERINYAEDSLQMMLERQNLSGLTFLDIGSGSGLFSLSARRLGARVHSFDYDPNSVKCTQTLKEKFFPADEEWIVEQGSILDDKYLKNLPQYDIVYSWGVLHHTGSLWKAMENAISLLKPAGVLREICHFGRALFAAGFRISLGMSLA